MKKFSDFNIKRSSEAFLGDKIDINKILNRAIVVTRFKVEDSKFKDKGKCLHMEISIADKKHVVFISSAVLIDMIQQVPADNFPFTTTIIKEHGFQFT